MADSNFSSAFREGTVIIEIGPDRKKYYIHKALIVHHSEYFRKALQGTWKEAQEGVVRLEDVNHHVMNLFVEWLYTGKIPTEEKDWRRIVENNKPDTFWRQLKYVTLIEAYVFGDRFLIEPFRKQVNNAFSDALESNYFCPSMRYRGIGFAFANIAAERPILQLLTDNHCRDWDKIEDQLHAESGLRELAQAQPSFLLRTMRRLREMKDQGRKRPLMHLWCYYEHESEGDEKACKKHHMRYNEKLDFGTFE
ncbi:hypothetical protein FB567DRAFT_600179 [Paraphoma chrysanthemicola]|uniref:BTB domain-containing protein n=1 Tax=Paraphoma chrysanthemicola TaxID=798071 RepID=A0A8K0RGU2_9PLEO|nr:hypothetical protein FB567DRAFT_600179 [Paraphoma chrysanthemicola]